MEFELKRIQEGNTYKEQILVNRVAEINPLTTLIEGSNVLLIAYLAHYKTLRYVPNQREDYLKLRMYINATLNYAGNSYNITIIDSPHISIWSMNTIKVKIDREEIMPVLITEYMEHYFNFSLGEYVTRDLVYKN